MKSNYLAEFKNMVDDVPYPPYNLVLSSRVDKLAPQEYFLRARHPPFLT